MRGRYGHRELSMQNDDRDVDAGQDDALPSVEMTRRFLAVCDRYGSHEAAVAAVARGRRAGVAGLPVGDDWPAWNAAQMRATVEYIEKAGVAATESAVPGPQHR